MHEEPGDPIQEPTGEITSDSLAAKSLNSSSSFADGHVYISGQKSTGFTAANTDTSDTTTLGPAPDAEARLATEEWGEEGAFRAGKGLRGGEKKGEREREKDRRGGLRYCSWYTNLVLLTRRKGKSRRP
jgi:hypothetical protein